MRLPATTLSPPFTASTAVAVEIPANQVYRWEGPEASAADNANDPEANALMATAPTAAQCKRSIGLSCRRPALLSMLLADQRASRTPPISATHFSGGTRWAPDTRSAAGHMRRARGAAMPTTVETPTLVLSHASDPVPRIR